MKNYFQKLIMSLLLGVMIFSLIAPILFWPKPAKAQWIVQIIESLPEVRKTIWQQIKEGLMQAAAVAWKNALNMFLGKVAQDAATYLGTFGKAGKPLFQFDKTFWSKMADSVVGNFLDEIAQKGFGVASLCDPIYPELKLSLLLYVSPAEKPFEPEVRCSLMDRWERIKDLSWKNLEWQGVQLQEGKAPAMNLKQRIDVDIIIDRVTKDKFIPILDTILRTQDQIKNLAERIKASLGKSFDKTPFEKEINNLKTIIKETRFTEPIRTTDDLVFWTTELNDCLKKGREDFCKTLACRDIIVCGVDFTESLCLGDETKYGSCKAKLKRGVQYAKQLEEMLVILEKALETIKTAIEQSVAPNVDILQDIQKKFTPESSDLGAAMQLSGQARSKAAKEVAEGKWLQGLQGEIQGITTKISGWVTTPGRIVGDWASQKLVADPSKQPFALTGFAIADAINTFTTTLLNTLMKTIFEKGIAPPQLTGEGLGIDTGLTPREKAESLHANLADLPLIQSDTDFDILNQYSSCPDKRFALPTQCVIDASFARAIEEGLTIKEAMDKNFIRKEWLITKDELMKIKKLRRARIVPLGLEIAAEKIKNGEAPNSTIEQIVTGFKNTDSNSECRDISYVKRMCINLWDEEVKACKSSSGGYDCSENVLGSDGWTWDSDKKCCQKNNNCFRYASSFCYLVDPNWPLKAPKAKCELSGPTAIPIANSSERQDACLQWKDCVGEDEKGTCHTFGYCTREKNTWRFKGTECPSYYNTCQFYTRVKDNQKFSWLKNTLDFNECNANSVGCTWYCQKWDSKLGEGTGAWACLEPGKSWKLDKFNRRVEYDDPYNTIFFNKFVETCPATSEGCHEFIRIKENLGTNLIPNSSFEDYLEGPPVSVKGWQITAGEFLVNETETKSGKVSVKFTGTGDLTLVTADNIDSSFLKGTRYTISFWVKNNNTLDQSVEFEIQGATVIDLPKTWVITKETPWQRVSWDFITPNNIDKKITDIKISSSGADVYLDDLQLEVGILSPYKEYATANKIYLKKAPAWMNCYDEDPNNDDPKCFDYLLKCQEDEVGCEKYTPVVGGAYIPAVGKDIDRCPRECVGYETFSQQPTNFYSSEISYFIPRTARTCPAAETGCEEFTNLDILARGGEAREYYSYIKPCQKPRAECQYFYTWVGSETAGYQLKKYNLLAVNNSPDQMLEYRKAKELWGKCENSEDARINPNCKEFYNTQGEVSYKLYKNTITCSETCLPLRKTTSVISDYCPSTTQGGTSLNGVSFDNGTCTYMAIPAEGEKCSAVNIGCREYQGNAASNLRILFEDDFENLTINPWTGGEFSSESIYFGGHSMKVEANNYALRPIHNLVQKGKFYLLSFWVKGSSPGQIISIRSQNIVFGDQPIYPSGENIPLDWRSYTMGPVYLTVEPREDESLSIESSNPFFIDNIILKEVQQSVFAIKNSWTTPEICDQNLQGNHWPQFHLGCQEYKDRVNLSHFFKSFSKLCSEIKIGCEALINTYNSTPPFKEEFNKTSPDEPKDNVVIEADKLEYLVNDSGKTCPSADKGCQKFGLPEIGPGDEPISWTDFYFKNNPDLYARRPILCQYHQQNCEEYRQVNGGSVYFKDPEEKICQWQAEKTPPGWYKKGTDQPCSENYLPDGLTYGIKLSTESGYQGYAGECQEQYVGCNEYVDPLSTSGFMNYIQDNDFEKGNLNGPPANPPWKGVFRSGESGGTISLAGSSENKFLKVTEANDSPPPSNRYYIYGAGQEIDISSLKTLPGASYIFSFEGKVERLDNNNSWASGRVQLFFEGEKSEDELNRCQDPECADWQEYRLKCNDQSECSNWLTVVSPRNCQLSRNGLKNCLAALLDGGLNIWNPKSGWAWNTEHGYESGDGTTISAAALDQGWQKRSLRIIAGGRLNPKNLKIKTILLQLLLDTEGRGGKQAKGEVYFDNIEFKPLDPYYYLDNDQLDKSSCGGQVSLKEGCVLFKDQSNPETYWNSVATYAASEAKQSGPVSAIDCTARPSPGGSEKVCLGGAKDGNSCSTNTDCLGPPDGTCVPLCSHSKYQDENYCQYCYNLGQTSNDTNLILKVRRDRVCGEWLTCAGKRVVWDKQGQKPTEICDHFIRCQKQTGKAEGAQCTLISEERETTPLTEEKYKTRDISWSGMDFSGISLYGLYPVEKLRAKNYPTSYAFTYIEGTTDKGAGNITCTKDTDCPIGQVCFGSKCVISPTCKVYPDKNAPFSRGLSDYYSKVNFCTEIGGANCDCAYRQTESVTGAALTPASLSYYFNLETDVESVKVCTQAENPQDLGKCCGYDLMAGFCPNGMEKAMSEDCNRTEDGRKNKQGKCEPMKNITDYIGISNYCLEPDIERLKESGGEAKSCLTWFPGEAFTGLDPYNQVRSAGYFPASDRRWYGYNLDTSLKPPYYFAPVTPLSFSLSSSFPCQRLSGNFGCCPSQLVAATPCNPEEEGGCYPNHTTKVAWPACGDYKSARLLAYCFRGNLRSDSPLETTYLVSSDHTFFKKDIEKITVNFDLSYIDDKNWCKDGCSGKNCCDNKEMELKDENIFSQDKRCSWAWKDKEGALCDGGCINTNNCTLDINTAVLCDREENSTEARLKIEAIFEGQTPNEKLKGFRVKFNDNIDKSGFAKINWMKIKLKGGSEYDLNSYLQVERDDNYPPHYLGLRCGGGTTNQWGCCQDLIMNLPEGFSRNVAGNDGDFTDCEEKDILAHCFMGNARAGQPITALYDFNFSYRIYEHMIDRIEFNYAIDRSDPIDCTRYNDGDCLGVLVLKKHKEESLEKKDYEAEALCPGSNGSARFWLKAIFDKNTSQLIGFKAEFNDDGTGWGSAAVRGMRLILKEGAQNLAKIVDKTYLPAVVKTNMVKGPPYNINSIDSINYSYECVPRGATGFQGKKPYKYIIDSKGEVCFLYSGGIYSNESELKKLFPKSYSWLNLNISTLTYPAGDLMKLWDERKNTAQDFHPAEKSPKVQAVCFASGIASGCQDVAGNPISGVTIGGQYQGDINVTGKAYTANLKFYAWADENYMPIREVIIDWGDGFQSGSFNMVAQNRKETCPSPPTNFGDEYPTACLPKYWEFVHTYVCPNGCSYQPKVYVKDNWGWCAGATPIANGWAGDASCTTKSSIPYAGWIIIRP